MAQLFRNHRQYQLLKWIDALDNGYTSGSSSTGDKPPTVSNLAYYLLTDAEYRKDAISDRFPWRAMRLPLDKDMFTFVKRDITRTIHQYSSSLFTNQRVTKSEANHESLNKGLEERCVRTKAYPLTEQGKQRLDQLEEIIQYKQDQITIKERTTGEQGIFKTVKKIPKLSESHVGHVTGLDAGDELETDVIRVPEEEDRYSWNVKKYTLPRLRVIEQREHAPLIITRS